MSTENMGYTANAIKSYLDEVGQRYAYNEDDNTFIVPLPLPCRLKFTTMMIHVFDDSSFGVVVQCPLSANIGDEATMKELMRLVCLINYTVKYIYMIFDPRDGELAVRCSVNHRGHELTDDTIRMAVVGSQAVLVDWADALIGVILGWKTADEMYELVQEKHRKMLNEQSENAE